MAKCYRIDLEGAGSNPGVGNLVSSNSLKYPIWRRFSSYSWKTDTIRSGEFGGGYTGCLGYFLTLDGVETRDGSASPVNPVLDESNPNCPFDTSLSTKTYDCLNGKCVENTNTSGYFKSLEDCQKLCAFSCEGSKQCVDPNTFCPPGKVCLDSSEFNQINDLASQIKGEVC